VINFFRELPAPLLCKPWKVRLLARFGFVTLGRYTDRVARCEGAEMRLDSANAAVGMQIERIGELISQLDDAENVRDGFVEDNGDLRVQVENLTHELANAQYEADSWKRQAERVVREAAEAARPAKLNLWDVEKHGALLRDTGTLHAAIYEAVVALYRDCEYGCVNDAIAPGLSEAERNFASGGANALQHATRKLAAAIRPLPRVEPRAEDEEE